MTLILAIEPDVAHADVLQQLVPDRVGAELVVVKSAAAAILEVNKRVPDVLLVGRSVWPSDQEVIVAHTESIGRLVSPLIILIPALRVATPSETPRSRFRLRRSAPEETGWEPVLFVDEIARRLDERRRSGVEALASPPGTDGALDRSELFERAGEPAQFEPSEHDYQVGLPPEDGALPGVLEGLSDTLTAPADAVGPAVEQMQRAAEERLAEEFDRLRVETITRHERHLEALEREVMATSRDAAVREARTVAEASAREALSVELANMRVEAEDAWSTGLAKARAEAQAAAESRLDAEVARFREEAEQAAQTLAAETNRVGAEAEARLVTELNRVREAGGEIARVRTESQATFDAELARFRQETEQARLERVWAQAELKRLAREPVQLDAAAVRLSVEQQARLVAEETTVHALETEVAKLKTGVGARLEADLGTLRQRADQAEVEQQQHRRAMERIREQALKDVRSFSEAMNLELARVRERAADRESSATTPASQAHATTKRARKGYARLALATAAGVIGAVAAVSVPPGGETAAFGWIDSVRLLGSSVPAQEPQLASGPSASTPPRASRRAQPGPQASRTTGGGFLTVSAGIPLELYVGGQRIGAAGDGPLPLTAGPQTIEVVSERFNFRGELPLDVRPGEVTAHTFALPAAPVRVETASGAEVWIDDRLVGSAPLGATEVPIGTHEVVARHPDLGERRQSVDVKFGETTDLTLDFSDAAQP